MVTIDEQVKSEIADYIGVDIASVKDHNKLIEDLGMDSIDIVQLGLNLEERLDLEIPDEAVSGHKTVGDVVEAIRMLAGRT